MKWLVFLLTAALGCVALHEPAARDIAEGLRLIDEGALALRSRELQRAKGAFSMALELGRFPAAVDGLGCTALLSGDPEAAIEYFNQALSMDSGYSNALGNLAMAYDLMGHREQAEIWFRRALEENPGEVRFRNNHAALLMDYGADQPQIRSWARDELLKASALVRHPTIEENIKRIP